MSSPLRPRASLLLALLASGLVVAPACLTSGTTSAPTPTPAAPTEDATPSGGESDAAAPTPDTSSDTPDAAAPTPDTSSDTPDAAGPDPDVGPGDPDARACEPTGGSCFDHDTCCAGFCAYTGQDYTPGSCQLPRADGQACVDGGWCLSGHCVDGVCQAAECTGEYAACDADADCCGAMICGQVGFYGPGACMPPQPDGAWCMKPSMCSGGICEGGLCKSDACQALAEPCDADPDCCGAVCLEGVCSYKQPVGAPCASNSQCANDACVDGVCAEVWCGQLAENCFTDTECCGEDTFCTVTGIDYSPGTCALKLPDGQMCLTDGWCHSGNCHDGTCAPLGCLVLEEPCYAATDCCSGMCTYDATEGYAPGQCATQQPNGQACIADAWCDSGTCLDGVCVAPSPGALTFDALYELVFVEEGCTNLYCHGSPFGPLDLSSPGQAYEQMFLDAWDQFECGAPKRVVPGAPEQSMLFRRTRPESMDAGSVWCGPKMPLGSAGLSETDAELIQLWIEGGALP